MSILAWEVQRATTPATTTPREMSILWEMQRHYTRHDHATRNVDFMGDATPLHPPRPTPRKMSILREVQRYDTRHDTRHDIRYVKCYE